MKKIIFMSTVTMLLVIVMAATACATDTGFSNFAENRSYAEGQFTDMPSDVWYEDDVVSAYELGLVNGTSENTFSPNGNISIAEAIAIAARLHSIYNGDGETFQNDGGEWYQPYVDYAAEKGIIAENEFTDYASAAARREFATIFAAALPYTAFKDINSIEPGSIYDVDKEEYYSGAVYKLYNSGIITGIDSYGTFKPESNIKRSEVSAIINRMVYPDMRVSFTPQAMDPVDLEVYNIISDMTLTEKVYQLFVIRPEALTGASTVTAAGESTRQSLERYPVGGVIYFAHNLLNPDQTKTMLSNMTEYAYQIEGMPLFLCVDEEGGRVARIGRNSAFNVTRVGPMQNIKDVNEAYNAGSIMGSYLSELGFNFDLAPVADVLTVGGNTDIGNRSFGSDPDRVAELAVAVSNGLHSHNIMSTFKHFPGNGATAGDTHEGFAATYKTLEELYETELKPFMAAQENGVDAVMVGHISVPNVTGENTPSSLSSYMVTEVLRNQLGYTGLIMTDSLGMGAVSNTYGSAQAAVMAFKAGNDILLMPQNFHGAVQGILDAVNRGEITEERLDESLRRIVKAKVLMSE